jgi:predicted enzyme related to lactoylglutathione lyase
MTDHPIKYRSVYFQLPVTELERAKHFYEDVFGLEVIWYMSPDVGWCELKLPRGAPRLGLNSSGRDDGGILTIEVENLVKTREYLIEKGVDVTNIFDVLNMVSYFSAFDSEGNRLQIVSDPRVKD